MSNKEMFAIAQSYGDPISKSFGHVKDYLSVENALNKNWQDALTFNNSTAAINAYHALNAFNDQEKKRKAEGEVAALTHFAQNLYDPVLGVYRPEHEAAKAAARNAHNTRNPYAMLANAQQFRDSANQTANQVAGYDPALAQNLRNEALGDLGIYARQDKDGTLHVINSQGYANQINDPNLAAMFGADPLKTRQTLAGWKRDDQVSTRDYMEQMGLNADQAQHNRTNNELSLRLQHQLNAERAKDEAALRWEYAIKEADYKQKNAAEQAKLQGNNPPFSVKDYADIRNSIFRELLAQGQDPREAHNNAEIFANDVFGLNPPQAATPAQSIDATLLKTAPKGNAPVQAATPPSQEKELGSSTFAGTRFGSYEIPRPAATRQAEIEQLSAYIAQMQAKHQQNAALNPNSYLTLQQSQAIKNAQRALDLASRETDVQYFERLNPIEAKWNRILYNTPNPQLQYK